MVNLSMLLAIDVGNTNTVIGLFEGEEVAAHWRVRTEPAATAEELAVVLKGLFDIAGRTFPAVTGMVVASVVPPVQSAWLDLGRRFFSLEPLVIDRRVKTGVELKVDNPAEVGADRIVNSLAGYARYRRALIIVDFGTAITFDCVSAKGEYLGGAIAPGLAISLEALGQRTAKLPRVDITTPPPRAIGTNTVDAIRSGILLGYGGMVEGLVEKICLEMAPDVPMVIATGGMAGLIAPYAASIKAVLPMLTLDGLRLLHERNP